jgi:hypothetical protein
VEEPILHVWVTKYALTQGIFEADAVLELGIQPNGSFITVRKLGARRYDCCFHGEGLEWHRTLEGAKAKSELMRQKKIASLKKAIAKLEGKEIKVRTWGEN